MLGVAGTIRPKQQGCPSGAAICEDYCMPYKLYNRIGSGGFAVEAALTVAGEEFELITIESQPSTPLPVSFREINPWGQVPVLLTKDGTMMTETAAILIYIAHTHPGTGIGPRPSTGEYASLLRWIVFMSANIYEGVLRRIYPERYTTDPDGHDGVRTAAVQRNKSAFAVLENELRPDEFILGAKMSVADIYLAMLYAWSAGSDDFPLCEALTHRVAAHSAVAPVWQRNFDHRLKIKWGRSS